MYDDLVLDLVVDGEVITTAEDHLFWSVTDQRFERPDELVAGEVVLGDDGREVTVSDFRISGSSAVHQRLGAAFLNQASTDFEEPIMWDTVESIRGTLTRDMPCPHCGHAPHTYLPCSVECHCVPARLNGATGTPVLAAA